jgi:beta-N-acetylhexosaminidase
MSNLANMKKKIGQRIIIGFEGTEVPHELVRLDEEWGFGGYILFKRNLKTPEQIFKLNESLLSMGKGVPPFIGIDQEGGSVARLPEPYTQFTDMASVGQHGTVSMAYEVGAIIGREMSASGFNLNFAPVLDINSNPNSPVIGKRAISSDPAQVAHLARAIIQGLHDNGVVACGKHFPGHGDTTDDSHVKLPICRRTEDQLLKNELIPYRTLIDDDQLDMVMMAHVMYPHLDREYPASLSSNIMQGFLRAELGFRGVSISDDLEMKAITNHRSMAEATHLAFEAGLDIFLVCHNLDQQMEVLETLMKLSENPSIPKPVWDQPLRRIFEIKQKHLRKIRHIDKTHALELIGTREHMRISRRLRDEMSKSKKK